MSAAAKSMLKAATTSYRRIIKNTNLAAVSNIKVTFDPFNKAKSARDLLYIVSIPKVKYTNPNCIVTSKIKADRSEPLVEVTLVDNHKLIFKSGNLSTIEMLLFTKQICAERIDEPSASDR